MFVMLRDIPPKYRRVLPLLIGLLVNVVVVLLYRFTNQLVPSIHYGLDWQIVVNDFDLQIYVRLGYYYQGFSLLGFFLPLVLMSIILSRSLRETGTRPDRHHLLTFAFTMLLFLTSVRITDIGVNTGVAVGLASLPLLFLVVALVGYYSNWENPKAGALILAAVVFFGMLPGDFLFGWIAAQNYPYATCIGGYAWGIGDGLWGLPLGMALISYISWLWRHDD